jgi:aldose 1-epimerase
LQVPARAIWTLEENLPTGERRKLESTEYADGRVLGGATFDDVLTDLDVGKGRLESLVMDPQAGIQVLQTCDAGFREMVAFTPPHGRSVCMEPYTCTTDAINLQQQGVDAGLRVLPPGGEAKMGITIEVSRVIV